MFDTLICKVPLPLPEDCGELKHYGKWSTLEFQTKDLQNFLGHYTIEEDGKLYEERTFAGKPVTFWDIEPGDTMNPNHIVVPCHQHGIINFYTTLYMEKFDYCLEYKATFTEGDLVDLSLTTFKKEDNSERLTKEASYKSFIKEQMANRSKLRYKIYSASYRKPLTCVFRSFRKLTQWCYSKSWKIESFLIKY